MSIVAKLLRTDFKCLRKFIFNFGLKGVTGFQKFQKRKKRGENFPAFQFISITDNNNMLIAKTLEGLVYIPSYGINTIGNLKPGVGYKVYVTTSDTLVYPGN